MMLTSGASEALATDDSGAFRVRATARPWTDSEAQPEDAHLIALSVWPDPKVHWQSLRGLHIDRAEDDRGQVLRPAENLQVRHGEGIGEYVLVRLGKGKNPSGSLKELTGRLSLQASTGPRVLAAVDKVLNAANRAAEGTSGVRLTVIEARRRADAVVVHVRLTVPPDVIPARKPERLREADLVPGFTGQVYSGLTLLDESGRPLALTTTETHLLPGANPGTPVVSGYTLTYRLPPGKGAPGRLVFYGMRTVNVEVPFRLQNVPLR
jgi:hypothetical protein